MDRRRSRVAADQNLEKVENENKHSKNIEILKEKNIDQKQIDIETFYIKKSQHHNILVCIKNVNHQLIRASIFGIAKSKF
jgi:hypothetical protein